ncbi:hypothetical protein ACTOB_004438 [Actinoplanes oblitus]|uniref:Uncharacterized protein n=1 Tax=Actinoplanes oblitus TaxID=3040509 RepID=A0ABY8W3R0_9ACTN|nr:hypothetical protein [Actinoplanes oblitus]WIM92496.1 hypothetical protein ACTOB_004438 [Actinoplanes oblitus]
MSMIALSGGFSSLSEASSMSQGEQSAICANHRAGAGMIYLHSA